MPWTVILIVGRGFMTYTLIGADYLGDFHCFHFNFEQRSARMRVCAVTILSF